MTAPPTSACTPYVTLDEVNNHGCQTCPSIDDPVKEAVIPVATDILFELTARRFSGECERTVRPVLKHPHQGTGYSHVLSPGSSRVLGWADPSPSGYNRYRLVRLFPTPVRTITEVKVDGVVLTGGWPATDAQYRVDSYHWLVGLTPTTGPNANISTRFPSNQNVHLPDTEDNTFSVTFTFGHEPPALLKLATIDLTCHLSRACVGDDENCALPANVRSVAREGLNYDMSNIDELREGFTGFSPIVDLAINTYNRAGLKRKTTIWSPDIPPSLPYVGTDEA